MAFVHTAPGLSSGGVMCIPLSLRIAQWYATVELWYTERIWTATLFFFR